MTEAERLKAAVIEIRKLFRPLPERHNSYLDERMTENDDRAAWAIVVDDILKRLDVKINLEDGE